MSLIFDIRDFGAVAGGESPQTEAIQATIDAAAGRRWAGVDSQRPMAQRYHLA